MSKFIAVFIVPRCHSRSQHLKLEYQNVLQEAGVSCFFKKLGFWGLDGHQLKLIFFTFLQRNDYFSYPEGKKPPEAIICLALLPYPLASCSVDESALTAGARALFPMLCFLGADCLHFGCPIAPPAWAS